MSDVEDKVINELITSRKQVNIYLASGIKLVGMIVRHDDKVLIMNDKKGRQVIYKHALSTIVVFEGPQ